MSRLSEFRLLSPLFATALAVVPAHGFSAYREETLENGLRVILIEHHANPMVASSIVVGAGVVHEPEGMSGGSHLLEHLLFNGTTTRTQRQLYDDVDSFGAYNNATTREDHTLFSLLIQKEFAEKGLEIQADMLFRSTIPPESFEKEKGIVLEEMARDTTDPGYAATEAFRVFAFAGTPLARPVLGTTASIGGATRKGVIDYYRSRYTPSTMRLVVMGDFDTASMLGSVRRIFGTATAAEGAGGPLPAPTKPKRDAKPAFWPPRPEMNLATMPLAAPRTYVNAAFPLGLSAHDPLVPAVELLVDALASGDDAPLQRTLTSGADAPALSAALGLSRRTGPWSTVEFSATVAEGKPWRPLLDALVSGLRDLGPASAARGRIDLVRARARAEEILGADQIHYYAMVHSEALLEAPAGWLDRAARRFDAVTDADLDAASAKLRDALESLRIHVAGPGLESGALRFSQPSAPIAATPGTPPKGSRVEATLPNGARVAVERNDDSQVFALHLLFRPRSASEPDGKEGITSFLHRLLARGTAVSDAAAFSARQARLGASLKVDDDPRVPFDDYYTTPEFSFVRLEIPSDAWREGVALLGEMLRFPRLSDEDVEAVRKEMLDLQPRRLTSSRNRAVDAAERSLAPGHAMTRPVLGTSASIASITAEDLLAFHKGHVSGHRAIATVVAPVDPDEVVVALRSALGDLPAGPAVPEVPPVPVGPAQPSEARAAELKDQATVVLAYTFDAPESERPALAVAGAMLSDALAFELREKRGLAYSMGATVAPWGGRMRLLVTMGTRKANVDEAIRGLKEGIAGFEAGDDAAVKRAAAALRGRLLMRRLTRINQTYYAGLDLLEGRAPGSDLERLDALLRLDALTVQAVTRKHLDAARCLVVVE